MQARVKSTPQAWDCHQVNTQEEVTANHNFMPHALAQHSDLFAYKHCFSHFAFLGAHVKKLKTHEVALSITLAQCTTV